MSDAFSTPRPDLDATTLETQPSTPIADVLVSYLASLIGYTVLYLLGRGGMGVVFAALQQATGRVVAFKTMPGQGSDALFDRFLNEQAAHAQLTHPHIVELLDARVVAGYPCLVTELMRGTLEQDVGVHTLDGPSAARLVEPLARAIQEAHRQEILHRDLKPSNVLLSWAGIAKIADFGLSKRLDGGPHLTWTGQIMGCWAYLAPELINGYSKKVLTPAIDIYGLGGILHFALTGYAPVWRQWGTDDLPAPPRQLRPDVPEDLEAICLRCLHRDPAERYASAADLAADLRRFLGGMPRSSRPAPALCGRAVAAFAVSV